eukprot:6286068-Prymnesium_polylepis.1
MRASRASRLAWGQRCAIGVSFCPKKSFSSRDSTAALHGDFVGRAPPRLQLAAGLRAPRTCSRRRSG